MELLVIVVVLVFSIIFHEVAHGLAALWCGDDTAQRAGRLTLNPIPHIHLIGSIILPGFLLITGSPFILAWAKPVPVNFWNLRNGRWGIFFVSLAGIITNFALAFIAAMIFRIAGLNPMTLIGILLLYTVFLNVLLGIFNLLPIPPLDGSRILTMWLSPEQAVKLERMSIFFIILIFVLLPWLPIWPLLIKIFSFLTGVGMGGLS